MQAESRSNLKHYAVLLMLLVIAAGLRFWNLEGAKFLSPDEYRALYQSKFHTPLFSLLYAVPKMLWGPSEESIIRFTAALGILSLLLVYVLAAKIWSARAALLSAALLSCSATHVFFSRSGYPAILLSVLFLAAVTLLLRGIDSERRLSLILSAIVLAASPLVYLPAYALLPAMLLSLGFYCYNQNKPTSLALGYALYLILFSLLWWGFAVYAETGALDFLSCFRAVGRFSQITKLFITDNSNGALDLLWAAIRFQSLSDILMVAFGSAVVISVLLGSAHPQVKFIARLLFLTYVIYTSAGMFGAHTLYARQYLHLLPLLAPFAASRLAGESHTHRPMFLKLIFVLLLFHSAHSALWLGYNTFRAAPMLDMIERHQFKLSQIATNLDLAIPESPREYQELPYILEGYPFGKMVLDWPKIDQLPASGSTEAIITSGVGTYAALGLEDLALQGRQPLECIEHPYNLFGHPFHAMNRNPKVAAICLYRIKE